MSEIEILFEFKSSKRALKVTKENLVIETEKFLGQTLGEDAKLVLGDDHELARSSSKFLYILQKFSKKWDKFVDVTDVEDVEDGDRFTASPMSRDEEPANRASRASTSTAVGLCNKVRKPSQGHASTLRKLFPSSSSRSAKRKPLASNFDPTDECAFAGEQKRKQGARLKPTNINLTIVKDPSKGVPRGKCRKGLMENDDTCVKVPLVRSMSSDLVRSIFKDELVSRSIADYKLLECDGQQLVEASEQSPCGSDIIDSALKRKGKTVYIQPVMEQNPCQEHSLTDAGNSQPGTSAITQPVEEMVPITAVDSRSGNALGTSCTTVADSDVGLVSSDDDLPAITVRTASSRSTSDLNETRRIVAEQDEEYGRSLEIDREKAQLSVTTEADAKVIEHMQISLQEKFAFRDLDLGHGLSIVFKLPNGDKVEHNFLLEESIKVLYEFIFSTGRMGRLFQILQVVPRVVLPVDDSTLMEHGIVQSCILAVEAGGTDVLLALDGEYEIKCGVVNQESGRDIVMKSDKRRESFIESLPEITHCGEVHVIQRKCVYEEVLAMYKDVNVLNESPLRIRFADEKAFDLGGVCRELFSAFWEAAYMNLFDGSGQLTPALHPQTEISVFLLLGRIISHGYLVSGYLPVQVAFPSLCVMLLDPVDLPDSVLLEAFVNCISQVELVFLKGCFTLTTAAFSSGVQEKLISLFSRFGSRCVPTPKRLRQQIIQLAKFEFVVKPMAATSMMRQGIPSVHRPFWSSLKVKEFHSLYQSLAASPAKVLNMLEEPMLSNPSQERVFSYLQQYVGNMKCEVAERFLRYVTGSSVCGSRGISVTFNTLAGLARRPLAHTCSYTLELSTEYRSYMDFAAEFDSILSGSDCEYAWLMDAV